MVAVVQAHGAPTNERQVLRLRLDRLNVCLKGAKRPPMTPPLRLLHGRREPFFTSPVPLVAVPRTHPRQRHPIRASAGGMPPHSFWITRPRQRHPLMSTSAPRPP